MLHSAYDPVTEAQQLVHSYPGLQKAGAVVCLGLGLGYHVREILRLAPPGTAVLVIEKDAKLTDRFAKDNPGGHQGLIVTDRKDVVKTFFYALHDKVREGFVLLEHPASVRRDPDFYREMRSTVRDYLSLLLVEIGTAKTLNYFIQENIFANLPAVIGDPGISALADAFKDKPAVIVAAGPSLNKNIHLLAEAKNRSVIICVGTALKAMLAQGLHPDIVVTLDPSEANYRHFEGVTLEEEFLCYEPQTHYKIPPLFKKRFVFDANSDPLSLWLRELYGQKGAVWPGGSVAIAAFGIACLLGANPVVFVGQDIALSDGYTHAKGTVYEGQKVDLTQSNPHLIAVPGINGGKVYTWRNMYSFLVRFEELFAAQRDRLIIDATEGGALKRGTKVMTFREAIDRYFGTPFPVLPVLAERYRQHKPDLAITNHVVRSLTKRARELTGFIRRLTTIVTIARKVSELSALSEKAGNKEAPRETLALLKKEGQRLNRKLKEVNARSELINLVNLLTVDVELSPALPEHATLKELAKEIEKVYAVYLAAAMKTQRQLRETAKTLARRSFLRE